MKFNVVNNLEEVFKKPVRDPKKLEEQQAYYKRLLKEGIAKKRPYDIQHTPKPCK